VHLFAQASALAQSCPATPPGVPSLQQGQRATTERKLLANPLDAGRIARRR
jgi:hypothetical protein